MKIRYFLILSILLSTLGSSALAKNLNLYDQPKADAKVIGTIDSEAGIVPIFTPKDSEWMKVGDPKNGNVGWIKSKDLSTSGTSGFSFTQRIIDNGKNPPYQIIQFGTPKAMTPKEAQAAAKQMQLRQQALQHDMQMMMNDMFKNTEWMTHFPIVIPVVVVPTPEPQPKPAKH